MTFDVMISHSTADKSISTVLCERLEAAGVRCWIAPRNIAGGAEWTAAILDGIASSRMMLLVFSAKANESRHVQREIIFATEKKLPILPFRIQQISPTGSLAYCLLGLQWLDGLDPEHDQNIGALIARVKSILSDQEHGANNAETVHGLLPIKAAPPATTTKEHDVFFACSECGRSLVIESAAAGTAVDCIFCGKETMVPGTISPEARDFDPVMLTEITDSLSEIIGPIANHLVRTTTKRVDSVHDLCHHLAEHIPDKLERADFLETVGHHARCLYVPPGQRPGGPVETGKAHKGPVVVQPEVLKRIKSEFAGYVGPVAGILVDRAMKESSSIRDLYERLAANIPAAKERDQWLRSGAAL